MLSDELKRVVQISEMIDKLSQELDITTKTIGADIIQYLKEYEHKSNNEDVDVTTDSEEALEKKKKNSASGLKGAITQSKKQLHELDGIIKDLRKEQTELKKSFEDKNNTQSKLLLENKRLENEMKVLERKNPKLQNQIEQLKIELKEVTKKNKELNHNRKRLKVSLDQKKNPKDTELINTVLTVATIVGVIIVLFIIVTNLQNG